MKVFDICMKKLKSRQGYFCLNDGTSCLSFGSAKNPVLFDYDEFLELCEKLNQKFNFDLIKKYKEEDNFAFLLPEDIAKFLDKKVCGIYYPYIQNGETVSQDELLNFFFENLNQINKSDEKKKEIFSKLG